MFIDQYIGDLSSNGFSFDNCDSATNSPGRIGPLFPSGRANFLDLERWSAKRGCRFKQTDWGTWVAEATKKDVHEYVEDYCSDYMRVCSQNPPEISESRIEELQSWIVDIRKVVKELDDAMLYGIVIIES